MQLSLFKYLSALLLLGFSLCTAAALEFKIITLHHRFAEDILPAIQPIVGNEGTATAMQNNLIIRTSPEKMAEIEQLIASLDTPRQNLKITVNRQNSSLSAGNSVEAGGNKRTGRTVISTGSYPARQNDSIRIGIENNQSSSSGSSSQFLQVLDGESAFISVGQSIPYTSEWVTLTQRYASVQRSTEFADISTGFAVRPRSIGSQVELEITPRFSQLNQRGFIDFDMLKTVIRADRGAWINIGGIMQEKDEVSRAILYSRTGGQSSSNQLLIRVD